CSRLGVEQPADLIERRRRGVRRSTLPHSDLIKYEVVRKVRSCSYLHRAGFGGFRSAEGNGCRGSATDLRSDHSVLQDLFAPVRLCVCASRCSGTLPYTSSRVRRSSWAPAARAA